MNKILLFFLSIFFIGLFFINISYASIVWQVSANGQVSTKPIVYSNSILVASSDGSAYLLNPVSGKQVWKATVPGIPTQPLIFSNKPVIALQNGKVVMLKQDGKIEWTADLSAQNVSLVYGADASISRIFVSTDKGIYSISASGTDIQKIYNSTTLKTAPTASESSLLFGEGVNLVKISNKNGALEWKRNVGGIWLSRPVIDGLVVYIGGLDKKLHAIYLNTGAKRWEVNTGGWVVASALPKNNFVYFGSDDGYVYAVGALDGQVAWKTKTPLAIQAKPEYGTLGGKEVIFVGSTANQIYAMDTATGEIVWSSSTGGWVSDPLFNNKYIIFGSADKTISAYSTERACAILNPKEGDVVGHKEIKVTGNAISQSGLPNVFISINGLPFKPANLSDMNWVYYIEPDRSLNVGLNTISCKVADSAGEESGELTSVGIVRDVNTPLSNLVVSTSGLKVEGDEFSVHVNDGDDGSPVEHFSLKVDGKEFSGSNSVNISLASGSYTLTVRKAGFNDAVLKLDIASKGISPLYLVVGAILALIVAWQLYERFIRKK